MPEKAKATNVVFTQFKRETILFFIYLFGFGTNSIRSTN